MRDHSNHIQVTRDEAIQAILSICRFDPPAEEVPLEESFGRMLAADAVAQLDMPNSLTCALDSVAVHWADFENGMPDTSAWQRGIDWEFANTGVGMPEGFDTAIVIEHVCLSDGDTHVSFDAAPSKKGAGTIAAGSRMRAGDTLVPAGAEVTPLLASYIASGGNTHVKVLVRPKVGFIPTGNELVPPAADIPRGKNIESNSLIMRGKIAAWGGLPIAYPICPDDPNTIVDALRTAAAECDIVVLNAGSSKGSDDYSLEVLEEIGQVLYHQTNHGPGHHSFAAVVDGTPIIGISGPPGGVAFTSDFYVKPAIDAFLGRAAEPIRIRARLAEAFGRGNAGGGSKPSASAGEKRPREGGSFFGAKQLALRQGADGMLEAVPASSSHPQSPEAERLDAYYLLDNSEGAQQPQPGDFIEVTLRPCRACFPAWPGME